MLGENSAELADHHNRQNQAQLEKHQRRNRWRKPKPSEHDDNALPEDGEDSALLRRIEGITPKTAGKR